MAPSGDAFCANHGPGTRYRPENGIGGPPRASEAPHDPVPHHRRDGVAAPQGHEIAFAKTFE